MRDSIDLYEKTKQRISTIKNERLDADRKKHLYNVLDIWKYESSSDSRVISITELFRKAEIHGIYESDYSNSIRTGFCILMKES